MMRFVLILMVLLIAGGRLARAQTNTPASGTNPPPIEITANTGHFDGIAHQMVYLGHVRANDARSKLACEQLTLYLPADGGRPTNVVAETNVVIDTLDDKGMTNHITAGKAVYAYSVTAGVTNETATFTGGEPGPQVETPQYFIQADPLVLNLGTKQYSGTNYRMIFKQPPAAGNGTNAPVKLF